MAISDIKRDIQYYVNRLHILQQKRQPYDSKWDELAVFCDPRNAYFRVKRSNGDLSQLIPKMDDTAQLHLPMYAAVLNSMMTPQAYLWHKMRFIDDSVQEQYGALLAKQNEMLFNMRYSASSHFQAAINEAYISSAVFGHAIIQIVPDLKRKRVNYYALPIKEFYIDKDAFGFINTFYRKVDMKMRHVLQQFPNYMPDKYKDRDDTKWLDDNIEVLHAVEPSFKSATKYHSAYIDITNKEMMEEPSEMGYCTYMGFRSAVFPSSDDPYGFSPCMSVLPSIKALNSLQFNFLKQTDLAGQPTLLTNSDIIDATKVAANGTVVEGGIDDEGRQMVQALRTYNEMPALDYQIQQYQEKIRQALFVNYLATFSPTQSRSATDAMIKANEKANLVAPAGDRIARELLLPLIEAELIIYGDMNILPKMPAELKDLRTQYDIILDSPLLKGQRMDSVNSAVTLMQQIGQIAAVDPNAINTINTDRLIRYLQDAMNVPASVMNSEKEVEAIAEAKANAQDMQIMAQNAAGVGSAVKDLAQAEQIMSGEQ